MRKSNNATQQKNFKLTQLSYAIGLSLVAGFSFAQSNTDNSLTLINVEIQEVSQPFSSQIQSIVDNEQFKATGAQNIDDVVMYDPSIDVRSDNMRTGHFGYNIRGIVHSRIQANIDGVPVAAPFEEPTPSFQAAVGRYRVNKFGNDVIETETLKQVEIDKVGNSAIYGNGGLGGSVNMTTYQPSDFVNKKKPFAASLKYGYRSTYQSHTKTAVLAGYSPMVEGLLMLTQRDSKQAKNFADNDTNGADKTTSNQQKSKANNLLAKANFTQGDHRLELTFEHYQRKVRTEQSELLIERSRPNRRNQTIRQDKVAEHYAKDHFKRERINVVYRYLPVSDWLDEINFQVYSQNLKVNDELLRRNESKITSTSTPPKPDRSIDDITYNNNLSRHKITGLRSEIKTNFMTGSLQHNFLLSADLKKEKMDRDRNTDYLQKTTSGTNINTKKEQDNLRFFPAITTTSYGLTLQDHIRFSNNIGLNLALRYQQDQLTFAKLDQQGKGLSEAEQARLKNGITHRTFSPSMRLSIPLNDKFTFTAGYAYAKKLPAAQFMAMGVSLDVGYGANYKISPNPSLKPETANNFDMGLLYQSETLQTKVNLYYNKYKDFLAGEEVPEPAEGYIREVRYINQDRVVTYGAELYAAWKFAKNWQLTNSVAWMKGYQGTPKKPLPTTLPLNGVVGLDYFTAKWGGSLKLRWANNKHNAGSTVGFRGQKLEYFKAPGYGVWDFTAYYKPIRNVEIRAGVFNLFNKKYWSAADVSGIIPDKTLDRYTQPGRNYNLNIELKY